LSDEDFRLLLETRDYSDIPDFDDSDIRDWYLYEEATKRGMSDVSSSKRLDQVLGGGAGPEASQQVQDMISDLVRQKLPGVD
jgi:hypothetical protein